MICLKSLTLPPTHQSCVTPTITTVMIMMGSDHRSGSFFLLFIPSCFFFFFCSILVVPFSLSTTSSSATPLVMTSQYSQQCLDLLNLKKGFIKLNESQINKYFFYLYSAPTSSVLPHWLSGTDCCGWEGVSCDEASGLVVSLDLSERFMGGNIMPLSLFNLTSLQRLNLAYNLFNQLSSDVLLSDWEKLDNLTHLNLSSSGVLRGQIPIGISRLTKLISLDLSSHWYGPHPLKLEKPDLGTLIGNLSNLKELYLDEVNISSSGKEWSHALSHSLPGLEALSLIDCSLSGPIDTSFSKLRNLSILHLDSNYLSQVPDFFANFSSLTMLSLSDCGLKGFFPWSSVFELFNLKTLDLSSNPMLATVSFGSLSNSLLNLKSLTSLNLADCNLSGSIPLSIWNLSELITLRLFYNHLSGDLPLLPAGSKISILNLRENDFSGNIPETFNDSKISIIDLSANNLTGCIPTSLSSARHLVSLRLEVNSLTGSIPMSLFSLPKLEDMILYDNKLSGQLQEFTNASCTLKYVDLSVNNLRGKLPKSLLDLSALEYLHLDLNNFDGSEVALELFGHLQNLSYLDLSGIDLLISDKGVDSSLLFPSLTYLQLVSCNLTTVPYFLKYQKNMEYLYLSNNRINGTIPEWIWSTPSFIRYMDLSFNLFTDIERPFLKHLNNIIKLDLSSNRIGGSIPSWILSSSFDYLNLSNNLFTDIERPFLKHLNNIMILDLSSNRIGGSIPSWILSSSFYYLNLSSNLFTSVEGSFSNSSSDSIFTIDLHSNLLQGPIPLPPPNNIFVDYSNNFFTSSIPFNISYYLNKTRFFSLSNNSLTGEVPSSICSATELYILDLSHNILSGPIPDCLLESLINLGVLNARENHFQGSIPQKVGSKCALQTINLHGNKLEGVVPSSWANCTDLEVLDLGRNKLADYFPYWLMNLPALKVLVLRENNFFGHLTGICKGNNFFMMLQIFDISSNRFTGSLPSECFKSMKAMMFPQGQIETIQYRNLSSGTQNYQNTVTVDLKGLEIELVKILTIFTSIDLSNNRFVGNIPEIFGDLKLLLSLNMSLNAFTGEIPQVFGDMGELESLDLSRNQLSGVIPSSLTSLYFLEFLNLSNNNLVGRVPQSYQFSTFSNLSFEGNPKLCGSPLSRQCTNLTNAEPSSNSKNNPMQFDMDSIWFWIFIGLGYGFGFATVIWYQLLFPKWKMWYKRRFMNR